MNVEQCLDGECGDVEKQAQLADNDAECEGGADDDDREEYRKFSRR